MYQHSGEVTNNHSEGYNFRLGNNQKLEKHPNVYRFVNQIKYQISQSLDNAVMANNGYPNIKERPNSKLEEGTVDILSIGQSIIKTNRPNTDMSNDQ